MKFVAKEMIKEKEKQMFNKYTLPKETEDERCIGILMPDEGSNENE